MARVDVFGFARMPRDLAGRAAGQAVAQARPIAIGGLAVSAGLIAWGLALWAGQRFVVPPVSFMSTPLPIAIQMPMALAYSLVGAILMVRRPGNAIGWIFLAIGLTSSVVPAIDFLVADATHSFVAPPATTLLLAWLASSFHLPMLAALVIVVFLIFPDGQPIAERWWIAAGLAITGALLVGLGMALDPDGLRWYPTIPNPSAAPRGAIPLVLAIQLVGLALVLASLAMASLAMVRRYLACTAAERRALVWIIAAVLALAASGAALLVIRYGIPVGARTSEMILIATLVSAALVPVAAALGMLRHHLFNVDLILNHVLVYVPLMSFLAGLYTASVALFTRLFVTFAGDSSDIVIVLSTLVLAGTFTPLRKALEGFVDRHFKPAEPHASDASGAAPDPEPERPRRKPRRRALHEPGVADTLAELQELQARLARLEEQLAGAAREA
jgi:hypothetical protein